MSLHTPVVFMVFNRPGPTARVLETIRRARPPRLLIICDGPRPEVPGDAERVAEVRRLIETGVDWPCELLTNYAPANLGCRERIASGLNWAFEQVEEAIILEDDTLPDPSFFPFCETLLERYRYDHRVLHIAGSNLAPGVLRGEAAYGFSRQAAIWGWATWRRAWRHYDLSMATWETRQRAFRASFASRWEAQFWTPILNEARLRPEAVNTWDFSWTYTCRSLGGYCVVPRENLVENIGIGGDSTHTGGHSAHLRIPASPAGPLRHPERLEWDRYADEIRTLAWSGRRIGPFDRLKAAFHTWRGRLLAPAHPPEPPKAGEIAIVIPCYKPFDAAERIAYRRIWELYGDLPIVMMSPPGLDTSAFEAETPRLKVERFEFRTVRDYSQLLLQKRFYERFRAFRYILIYQLDAYILRDELEAWCQKGFDYVGAPIFHGYEPPEPEGKLWCVGNGGFSLRNVDAALRVLSSRKRYLSPRQYWERNPAEPGLLKQIGRFFKGLSCLTRFHNDVAWAALCNFHEDIFWALEAKHFSPGFKVPGVETGLQFAFDYAPAYCYEQNGGRLPFGCHAWQRYDLPFWKTHIPEAADLPVPFKP